MADRKTSSPLHPDSRKYDERARSRAGLMTLYVLTVGAAAAGLGSLAKSGLSAINSSLGDSGLVVTVLVIGALGGFVGDRSGWFDR